MIDLSFYLKKTLEALITVKLLKLKCSVLCLLALSSFILVGIVQLYGESRNEKHDTNAKRHTARHSKTLFEYNLHIYKIANIIGHLCGARGVLELKQHWMFPAMNESLWNVTPTIVTVSLSSFWLLLLTCRCVHPWPRTNTKHLLAAPSFVSTFLDRPTKWAFALSILHTFLLDFSMFLLKIIEFLT